MKILKIRKRDKEQVYHLVLEANGFYKKKTSFPVYILNMNKKNVANFCPAYFKKDYFSYGIYEEKRLVALLHGYIKHAPRGKVGYIENMVVSPSCQGEGYSKKLYLAFLKFLKAKKIKYCQLDVLYQNKKAVNIYKRWGFKEDGLRMTKKI